jgi:hypothetical protein
MSNVHKAFSEQLKDIGIQMKDEAPCQESVEAQKNVPQRKTAPLALNVWGTLKVLAILGGVAVLILGAVDLNAALSTAPAWASAMFFIWLFMRDT